MRAGRARGVQQARGAQPVLHRVRQESLTRGVHIASSETALARRSRGQYAASTKEQWNSLHNRYSDEPSTQPSERRRRAAAWVTPGPPPHPPLHSMNPCTRCCLLDSWTRRWPALLFDPHCLSFPPASSRPSPSTARAGGCRPRNWDARMKHTIISTSASTQPSLGWAWPSQFSIPFSGGRAYTEQDTVEGQGVNGTASPGS